MKLAMIACIGKQGQLGLNGKIPWKEPQDLFLFKQITLGHILIMGRKTAESLRRPLPGRTSFVVSRDPSISVQFPWAVGFASLQAALHAAHAMDECPFVIGGAALYAEAAPQATDLYLGEVSYDGPADTFFHPNLFLQPWSVLWTASYSGTLGPATMTHFVRGESIENTMEH